MWVDMVITRVIHTRETTGKGFARFSANNIHIRYFIIIQYNLM